MLEILYKLTRAFEEFFYSNMGSWQTLTSGKEAVYHRLNFEFNSKLQFNLHIVQFGLELFAFVKSVKNNYYDD